MSTPVGNGARGGMTLILGIDPGSRITGYGVVRDTGRSCEYVASGCIRTGEGALPERLQAVFRGVSEVIRLHGPVTMGIEQVFMAKNADSALKLGQARGVAVAACAAHGLTISDYEPTLVKKSLVGTGRAEKEQVAFMVQRLLNVKNANWALDTSDALAVAVCHLTVRRFAALSAVPIPHQIPHQLYCM